MNGKLKKILLFAFIVISIFFINTASAFAIAPSGAEVYEGIDVSNWQGYIDYNMVKSSGIDIVYIKASQGSNTKDAYFDINYENAKANGLKVGFYHYVMARSVQEAEQEATFFASVIAGKIPDCKLAMDFEAFGDLSGNEINEISNTFLETVKRLTNKEVILYSDLFNAQNTFSSELAENYQLWLAYYSNNLLDVETKWENYVGLQYTDRGIVSGIEGEVDRDIYTEEILLDQLETLPDVQRPSGSINTETLYYTVQSGDTLWRIARQYGTTVQEIVAINQIENPNLIYPGQTLKIITNSTVPGTEIRKTGSIIYIVQSGNTLSGIAEKYGVTVGQIVEMNDIENPNLIYPGEKIRIKGATKETLNSEGQRYYTIQRGDTLSGIARRYGVSVNYLVRLNGIKDPNLIYPGTVLKV